MRYIGGECDQSANMQVTQCMDLRLGGSGPDQTSPVYIEVNDLSGTLLFSGTVNVGQVYTLTNGGNFFENVATIRVFSDESKGQPLQRVSFSPACGTSVILSMNDIFGSSQVVGWTNAAQGVVDSTIPQTLIFNYTISNNGAVQAELQVRRTYMSNDS